MSEPRNPSASERPSSTGPWPSAPVHAPDEGPDDPPTVIRGSTASDLGSAERGPSASGEKGPAPSAAASGSSVRRARELPSLPRPGDTVGTFVLEEAIGIGGMGAVFRALDTQLDRSVALKLLPPEMSRDVESVQRFYQEGRAAARLDHENIARVFSIGHDGAVHYIAFEYIGGTTIRQKVERDGILAVGEAIEITLQVAEALVHASARGVVHRDVKPSNVVVTPEGRAKLVDMGLARRFERGGDAGLTQTGMTLGTFDYISPEQARDPRDVDVRGDLYSLGCTLFFMLTGRPPFPDGTVLQKLIKHQEEPPPDVRSLNPGVPSELASVLLKLMDKDRERRYQTPDQLVRDLLNVAAMFGLNPNFARKLAWAAPAPPPAWERHLVWGVPALAFAVLISGLIFVNATTPDPRASTPGLPEGGPRLKEFANKPAPTVVAKKETGPDVARPAGPSLPREIVVNAGDDLLKVMAEAPPRSTILLADEGPYTVRQPSRGEAFRLSGLDLTVRADIGPRPVVRLARGTGEEPGAGAALFDLKGGRLVLEGLELVIDASDREIPTAAVQAEDVDLVVSRCVVRRSGLGAKGTGRGVAFRLKSSPRAAADADRKAGSAIIDACHVDAGLVALVADGPVDVSFRDAALGPAPGATFEIRNAEGDVPASLHLRHVSAMIGGGPAFLFSGLPPRVRVSESVFAPTGDVKAALVEADDPARLDWRGTDNLYGRIGVFLRSTKGDPSGRAATSTLDAWADDASTPREFGSVAVAAHVWDDPEPARNLGVESQDPSRLFKLAEARAGLPRLGARVGPFGAVPIPTKLASEGPAPRAGAAPAPATAPVGNSTLSALTSSPLLQVSPFLNPAPDLALRPMTKTEPDQPVSERPTPPPAEEVDNGLEMPEMPVMPPMPIAQGSKTGAGSVSPSPSVSAPGPTAAAKTAEPPPRTNPRPDAVANAEPNLVRTAAQFLQAIGKASRKGETLRLAADADLELPSSEIVGEGSWTIRAEQGNTRPKIRFRPAPADPAALKEGSRPAWLTIPSAGGLRLEGVDLVVPSDVAPGASGLVGFAVVAGGDLSLTDCTVTIEGERAGSAVIRIVSGPRAGNAAEAELSAPTIRLKNSLVRSGGDLVDVDPNQPLDLELDNVVASTAGGLLHGRGGPKGEEARTLKTTLRQVSARVAGGVVLLDSTPGAPELPFAEIVARNSVFATNPQGGPLVRIDGQDDPDSLRGRVHWDSHNVAYHRINTYRRDETRRLGASPTLFDRASWEVAVGRREMSAIHDDLKFARQWDGGRPSWSLEPEDLRLRADSPAARSGSGADLVHIPAPPAEVD